MKGGQAVCSDNPSLPLIVTRRTCLNAPQEDTLSFSVSLKHSLVRELQFENWNQCKGTKVNQTMPPHVCAPQGQMLQSDCICSVKI